MDLIIRHTRPSHETSLVPTCFISLSTSVASSLWRIKPSSSLTILSIRRKQNPDSPEITVAWTGHTHSEENHLGIDHHFASLLQLSEGTLVQVSVTERVLENAPVVTVVSATLRPLSYPDAKDVEDGDLELGRAQYNSLNTLAEVLESSILPQIRVLQKGLKFPVSIPGKDHIDVEVTQIQLSATSSLQYGVLMPGSELLIEPPPQGRDDAKTEPMVRQQFRVIPHSECLRSIPREILLTHAVLPIACVTSVEQRAARVVKTPPLGEHHMFPVAFLCREGIPKEHVWLPPFLWQELKLAPLDPVFVEEVRMFHDAPVSMKVARRDVDSSFPSFDAVRRTHGVIYNGLRLRNGKLQLDRVIAATPQVAHTAVSELVAGKGTVSDFMASLSASSRSSSAKQKIVPGFRIGDCEIALEETGDSYRAMSNSDKEETSIFNPMVDEVLRARLAERLTRLSRTVVHDALAWARRVFSAKGNSGKSVVSNILLIYGPEGCGKTLVCKTITAILRSVGLLRTIWIQCSANREKSDVLIKKLQLAYGAAVNGGPGVVVLDDVDFWVGGRRERNQQRPEESQQGSGDNEYAQEILYRMKSIRTNPVLSIITCRDDKELDESFRAPGVIGSRFSLELPGREDMSVLRWAASQAMDGLSDADIDASQNNVNSAYEEPKVSLEGYNAKEIQLLYSRAMNEIEITSEIPRNQQVTQSLEKMMSEMTPGGMKRGSRPRKKDVPWIWKRIGGADIAKKALTEVLLWPSKKHELFQSAPMSLPRGVLLYGPPGCGKTLLAKAAAHESKMRCIVVKGPELMSKYIGESEAEVRRAFERASRLRPCVLLFDEFDSLAPRRGSGTGVSDRVVNTLLTCMDGAERLSQGVYLLATSSRPELLDPAVLRPGRIDRWVPVEVPASVEERYDILRRLSEDFFKWSHTLDTALRNVAQFTEDYTGADLGAVLNDARIKIRKRKREKKIGADEVVEALAEALKESHPSMSHTERARFSEVMESFSRTPGRVEKILRTRPRVALH